MKSSDPRILLSRKADEALERIRNESGKRDPVMDLFPDNFDKYTRTTKMNDMNMLNNFFKGKRLGLSDAKASQNAGLSKWTLYEWKAAGTEEIDRREQGEEPREDRDPYVIFMAAYYEATYAPVRKALDLVQEDIEIRKNIDTAKWLLERLAPEDYGRINRFEIAHLASKELTESRVASLPAPQAEQLVGLNIVEGEFEVVDEQ